MMSFYFIDDDKNICNILKLIINERGLGVCCGSANNAAEALEDLPSAKPDIVGSKNSTRCILYYAVPSVLQRYDCFCL